MFFVRIGHAAVLLLVLSQSLGLTSVGRNKNEKNTPSETVANYLRLPWLEGIDWLANSTESPEREEAKALIRGIESGEPWAMQILDALSEEDFLIQQKNTKNSENFNKCAVQKIDGPDEHCTVQDGTVFERPASDMSGECRHSSSAACESSVSHKPEGVTHNASVGFEDLTPGEISTIIFCLVVTAVLIGCTMCDFVKRNSHGDSSAGINTMAKFSIYTNALSLLKAKSTVQELPAIHGIRCFCCLLIIYSHRILIVAFVKKDEITLLDILRAKTMWSATFLQMTGFAVESFSVISGFFITYLYLRNKQSESKFDVLTMYLYRYFRLTPCLATVILFVAVVLPRFGSGPLWESLITAVVEPCREKWWVSLLYVHNFFTECHMCLSHTWYLALDMQLFWLSPMILYPLHRWPRFGTTILGLFIVISAMTPAITLADKGYANVWLRLDMPLSWHVENAFFYYIPTYNRVCSYLIGILLGYDIVTKKRNLSQMNVVITSIAAGSLMAFCMWSIHRAYNSTFAYDLSMEMMWAALVRPCWSIATAWVIYACTQGYGGFVTRFLSLPIFLPLSRLSYTIYLVHPVIQVVLIARSQVPFALWDAETFHHEIFYEVVLSIAVAFVFNLFTESPALALATILINKNRHQTGPATQKIRAEKKRFRKIEN